MLCLQLPKLFFNDALTLLKKHFNQWRSEKTFKTLFISKPETPSNIAQWHLGTPSSEGSIWYDFLKRAMHVPSFINFATELVSVQALQQESFMKEHRRGILLLACNANMHASNEPEVVRLRKYCLETFLPMFTNAQNVESSVKDTVSTKATGREEDMTSMIAMMRSCLLQPITTLTKNDPDYTHNRVRRNEEARELLQNKHCMKNMMQHVLTYFPHQIPPLEHKHCEDLLKITFVETNVSLDLRQPLMRPSTLHVTLTNVNRSEEFRMHPFFWVKCNWVI